MGLKFYESVSKTLQSLFGDAASHQIAFKGRNYKRISELIWKIEEEENIYKKAKLKVQLIQKLKHAIKEEGTNEPYIKKALSLWHTYEETVFNLSEQSKNETIESIKRMSLGQRMKFQELIAKRNTPKSGKEI